MAYTEEQKAKMAEINAKMKEEYELFKKQQIQYIQSQGNFTASQSEMIFQRAWEDGHANGYTEVCIHIEDLIDWLNDFNNAK